MDANVSATKKVIDYIKERVVSGKWTSGQQLPTEQELCDRIGVSRGSVREAMKKLEVSNIVKIKRGVGTYISEPEEISLMGGLPFKIALAHTTMEELDSFRESLEMAVMRLAINNATQDDIDKLAACIGEMQQYVDDNVQKPEELFRMELEFHDALGVSTHNLIMKDVYTAVFELFSPFMRRNYMNGQSAASALETHVAIYDAIINRDFLQMGYAIRLTVEVWREWIDRHEAIDPDLMMDM